MADDPTTSPESDAPDMGAADSETAEAGATGSALRETPGMEQAGQPEAPTMPAAAAAPDAPVAPPPEPSIATTLVVEPTPSPLVTATGPSASVAGDEEGGEWELLLQKLRHWLNQNELPALWAQAQRPVTALAALVGLLLVLRVYAAVLGALDSVPLVPGLLELVGVAWLVRYGIPKLLLSSERERLLRGVSNRWKAFRGQG